MARVLAPFLLPGSDDPDNSQNRCRLPPSQGNFWQTPLFTNAQAMIAYWRVRKWRVDVDVSGAVVGSIGCNVEMDAGNESQLVCAPNARESVVTRMPYGPELQTDVVLAVGVFSFGIFINVEFLDYPEGGDSLIEWGTTNSSGSNQITLTTGSITKNLVGKYFGSEGFPEVTATGTMNAVEWWSYDGLYNTSTGESL